jgi:hypothetical protein
MSDRNVRVMIADDNEGDLKSMREAVNEVLSEPDIIACSFAFERGPGLTEGKVAANKIDELADQDEFVDVLIADSKFDQEGDTAGKELIERAYRKSKATRLFFITDHATNYEHEEIPEAFAELPREIPEVVSRSKNIFGTDNFTELIKSEVEDWTRHMVRRSVGPGEREKVRRIIYNQNKAIADEIVTIRGETWRVEDLCPTYFSGSNIDFQRLRDLFSVDLTLAFSRAFGIWGLKAITHDNDKYFPDDARKITNKAQQQLKALKRVVENAPDGTIRSSVQQNLKKFQIPNSPDCFDTDLREKRQKNFQFQGEADRRGISGNIADVLKRAASVPSIELTSFMVPHASQTDSSVELHVPVHEHYESQFATLFESIERKAEVKEAEVTFWNYGTGRSEYCEGYEAKIHDNCIVIRNKGNAFNKESITGRDPGTVISCFSSANFGSFGKFYLAASPDGEEPCKLFDCTFSPATKVSIEEVFAESPKIQEQLMNPGGYVTYYLFIFSCWRPKPKTNS